MGQGRPTGASYGAAHATIDLDLAALTAAPKVAQAAGEATAKALQQSLKIVQNEQKIAIANAQAALVAMKGAQEQATVGARAQSQERIQQARAEATSVIEQERRKTAQFKQEIKERNQAASRPSFGQSAASFVGAAVGGPIGGLVGAAVGGNPAIAAGLAVNQGARFAVDAAQMATAYNRQNVAAVQLAGSQGKLNSLMAVYDKATGGIVNKSDELSSVTKLMAVGFADNTKELDQFARAIRGIGIAMGTSADTVTQNLILELFSQRGQRLDQLGLQYEKVRQRSAELQAQDGSLTKQMAYQQAVIEQAIERYGKLAGSAEGAGTGIEKLSTAWTNFQLKLGQADKGAIGGFFAAIAKGIDQATNSLEKQELLGRRAALRGTGSGLFSGKFDTYAFKNPVSISDSQSDFVIGQSSNDTGRHRGRGAGPINAPRFNDEQQSALVEWNQKRVAIERETQAAVVAEARSWGNQRLEAERAYTKQSVREAEDWARQQARTQADFQESLAKVTEDSAKQQARAERDLGRSIATEQADSAEKVADIRKDSAKRIKEIEESYAEDREKAAKDHSDRLLDAAGNLDAKAVYEEQRNYAKQAQEAKKAHDKQVTDAKEQLDERVGDEAKSLEKSIRQQKEALALREADQAADDAQRLIDMKAQFDKEQGRAVEDRGVRLGRMAQDQQDQLDAIDRAHHDRMDEIAQHAAEQNKALQTILTDAHIGIKGFVDTSVDDAIKAFDKFYGHMEDKFNGKKDAAQAGIPATPSSPAGYASGGWVGRGGFARVHAGEFMLSNGMLAGSTPIPASVRGAISNNSSSNITLGDVSVTIAGSTNMGKAELKRTIIEAVTEVLEEAA